MNSFEFPKIKRSIKDFIEEEDGRMLRNKAIAIGSLMVVMGVLLIPDDVSAKHGSHGSHGSHKSHSSGGGHLSSHESHVSHVSHTSHSSGDHSNFHSSHSSSVHSNSHSSHTSGTMIDPPETTSINPINTTPVTSVATSTSGAGAGVVPLGTTTTITTTTATPAVTALPESTTLLKGDANLDGVLDVRDAAYIAKNSAQATTDILPMNADFNDDGKVNIRDAAAISKHLASDKK